MSQSVHQNGPICWQRIQSSLLSVLIFFICAFIPIPGKARDQREETKSLVESIAGVVYAAAWPTATYENFSIKSIDPVANGYDVLVKLSGKSGWNDGDLWLVIVFNLRNGELKDVSVVNHNALLSPPFATTKAIGELIADLAEEGQRQSRQQTQSLYSGGSEGYKFFVTNRCRHAIDIALKYRKINGEWATIGWWGVSGNSSRYLSFKNGDFARTNNSIAYYFAETKDGRLYWGDGTNEVLLDGRRLPMSKVDDSDGDTDLTLTCPGQ